MGASGRVRCAGGRSSPRRAPISPSSRCAEHRDATEQGGRLRRHRDSGRRAGSARPRVRDRRSARTRCHAPQVGQGALAVECRAGDAETLSRLVAIDDAEAHRAVAAERAFLERMGGGCDLPVGALALAPDGARVAIEALLATLDGGVVLRVEEQGDDPASVGAAAAARLLAMAGSDAAPGAPVPSTPPGGAGR
ncbi:MAG: hypothetical protein M5T61_07590 [Acidimicrobiia bacterium]|nr:hypothetical protein [Acidimicrobiia bacterium]